MNEEEKEGVSGDEGARRQTDDSEGHSNKSSSSDNEAAEDGHLLYTKNIKERRRQWLSRLRLSHLEARLARFDNCEDAGPSRQDQDSEDFSLTGISAATSSVASTTVQDHSQSLLADAEAIPLDNEGWQVAGFGREDELESALDSNKSRSNGSNTDWTTATNRPKLVDGWTTAVSRRKARRRRLAGREGAEDAGQLTELSTNKVHDPHDMAGDDERKPVPKEKNKRRKRSAADPDAFSLQLPAHRDEAQVALDVRRSFIDLGDTPSRKRRREQLSYVICGILRKYPRLNYYQGYHDVIAVFLTVLLPEPMAIASSWQTKGTRTPAIEALEAVVDVAARFSLHFLRDGMAKDMTPTLGHLKLLRSVLIHSSSPLVVNYVDKTGPLPYFALPWLLSVFAHDVKMDIACRLYDHILVHGPARVVCLAAALIDLYTVAPDAEVDDPAEVHHLLAQLPEEISQENIGRLFERADQISHQIFGHVSDTADAGRSAQAPSFGRHIMGPQSVLYTWISLPRQTHARDWQKVDADASQILGEDISSIVIDALPSPPPSPPASTGEADLDDAMAITTRSSRRKRHLQKSHDAPGGSRIALFSAVGAVGVALLIVYSSGNGAVSSLGSSSSALGSNVLGRDAAAALLRSSEAVRQLFRQFV